MKKIEWSGGLNNFYRKKIVTASLRLTAKACGVEYAEVAAVKRKASVSFARQLSMYLCHVVADMSLREVARRSGVSPAAPAHHFGDAHGLLAEVARRNALLEAANKELEAFSYSVSHDLRAPLRHIDGYASLLNKAVGETLNDKAKRYLQTISDSAKQMGQLIDDLLVFSRMGRQEMLHTTVNLDQLIKTILYDLRLDLQGREISWTIDTLPEVPGDPAMLRQVFVNLISNAIKFTSTRPVAKIAIGVERKSAGEITVFVRDNGVGFDMQYLDKLFGVFQRLHRADEFEGTGIGLANVRRIVHRHGGRVWAEGIPDQGATFFVTLPTRRPRT